LSGKGGLYFECTECGGCCTYKGEYAHVYASKREVEVLAELQGVSVRTFKRRYTFRDEYGWTQLRTNGDHCVFLDPDTRRCTVYKARPTQCRTFPFWPEFVANGEWTDEVRGMCEGIGRGRLYSIDEADARMIEMANAQDE
jgi:Fe-S-cluster containining protein